MGEVEKFLLKKAKGFHYKETVEEYDAEGNLLRRKLYDRYAPPDVAAIKAAQEQETDVSAMSDEQLKALREKLMARRKEET